MQKKNNKYTVSGYIYPEWQKDIFGDFDGSVLLKVMFFDAKFSNLNPYLIKYQYVNNYVDSYQDGGDEKYPQNVEKEYELKLDINNISIPLCSGKGTQ